MDEKKLIHNFLFGIDLKNVKCVVVTPLTVVFEKVKNQLSGEIYEVSGIYKCFVIGKTLMVKCPQGIQAQDSVVVLENVHILFVGFAGGFDDALLGKIMCVGKAILPTGESVRLNLIEGLSDCTCGYSPALLGTVAKKHQKNAKELGCNIVDMEIAYCSMAATYNNVDFRAMVLITDLPGVIELWEKEKIDHLLIDKGVDQLCQRLISYIRREKHE